MSTEIDLIESANALATLLESDSRPFLQRHRDALLKRATRRIEKLTRTRFRSQRKAILASHALHTITAREADATDAEKRKADITTAISAVILHQPVTAVDSMVYATAIRQAIDAGASGVAQTLNVAQGSTESFIAEYLKSSGFTKLTGEIDKTTVDRLATAISKAYESGSTFDQTTAAVRREFADMTATRAKMIAQTELNDAFNQSILHFGREAGATMKSWETDLAPCPICIENALAGEIPIEDDFPSGDDAAPGHPNCLCSTLVHANN